MSVSDLAEPFPVSLPAIMKHLDVLSDAGLITRRRPAAPSLPAQGGAEGRDGMVEPIRAILDRAARSAGRISGGRRSCPPQTATKPSLTLKRRLNAPPAKVFSAWTDPEKIKRWMGPGEVMVVTRKATRASAAAIAGS